MKTKYLQKKCRSPLTPVVPLRQLVVDYKKMKEEKEMYKDISINENQDRILMERESRWVVMKSEENKKL